MTTTIHRQIGKMGKRSADDASVAMIIKEVHDAETLLAKLMEHTKAWRDAWTDILVTQVNLTDSFHDVYKPIPMPGDSKIEPLETPISTLRRVAKLHAAQNDLKTDMMEEIEKVDRLLVERLTEAKAALKPVKKAIEKREHKKLDYERFNKQVENSKAKKNKSDRDYSVLSKVELDLEKAKNAYENADNHIKEWVPSILAKIIEFIPCIVDFIILTQYTLLQNTYSAIYEYTQEHSFTDPEGEVVIAEWEDLFLPVQKQLESEIISIARGKAVTLPMTIIVQEKSFIPRLGRGNKPPPPPPPVSPGNRSPTAERPMISRVTSKFSRDRDEEPPPHPASSRPPIRARPSNSNLSAKSYENRRDESPPPPLPGPRPSMSDPRRSISSQEQGPADYKSLVKSRSFGSNTPLAGIAQRHAQDPHAAAAASNYLSPGMQKSAGDMARRKSAGASTGGSELDDRLAVIRAGQGNLAKIERSLGENRNNGTPKPPMSRSATGASTASYRSAVSNISDSSVLSSIASKKKPPPPPPPKKKIGVGKREVWVKALFTFEGQDEGDLSFREGERILVVRKTESVDDWWEGELNGRKGQFPANYTEMVG